MTLDWFLCRRPYRLVLENLSKISWNPSPILRFPSPKIQFSSHEIRFSPIGFPLSSTAFRFSSTAFIFPRNPRKSIYGGKYTKDHYLSFVFPTTCSPSFVIPLNLYRHSLSKLYSKHWTDTRSKQEKCAYQPMILDQRYSNVGLARPLVNISPSCLEVSIFKSLIPCLLISSQNQIVLVA